MPATLSPTTRDNFTLLSSVADPSSPSILPAALNPSSGPDGSPVYRPAVISYRTVSGDTLDSISEKFAISPATIRSVNSNLSLTRIRPGLILKIPPVSGDLYELGAGEDVYKVLERYQLSLSDFERANPGLAIANVVPGSQVLIPGDRLPRMTRAVAVRGAAVPLQIPTRGYNWGVLHSDNAIDIANSCGAAVMAAADGVVVTDSRYGDGVDGWNGGYGTFLLIDHGNGVRTRYAHLESVAVAPGDAVKKGEIIGKVGKTGEATGCHLHFEVLGTENPFVKK